MIQRIGEIEAGTVRTPIDVANAWFAIRDDELHPDHPRIEFMADTFWMTSEAMMVEWVKDQDDVFTHEDVEKMVHLEESVASIARGALYRCGVDYSEEELGLVEDAATTGFQAATLLLRSEGVKPAPFYGEEDAL